MRRAVILLTAALALAAGASSAGATSLKTARAVEAQLNSVRADHGCGPLVLDAGLTRAADSQARLLLAVGRLDHDAGTPFAQRLWRAAPGASLIGENLAWGAGRQALPGAIVRQWMNSPAHRDVLLDCRFSQLGVGIANGTFGDHENASVYAADFAA